MATIAFATVQRTVVRLKQMLLTAFARRPTHHVSSLKPKELWRVYSNPKMKLGAYWSDVPPSGPVQATVDSALHHTFQNAATLVVHIRVPAGTTIFEGIAGPKEGLIGGGPQFLVRKRLPSWEV